MATSFSTLELMVGPATGAATGTGAGAGTDEEEEDDDVANVGFLPVVESMGITLGAVLGASCFGSTLVAPLVLCECGP